MEDTISGILSRLDHKLLKDTLETSLVHAIQTGDRRGVAVFFEALQCMKKVEEARFPQRPAATPLSSLSAEDRALQLLPVMRPKEYEE